MTSRPVLPALMLVLTMSTLVLGGKPNSVEQFGGNQCFSFRDDLLTDAILSDFGGEYCPLGKKIKLFSTIERNDRYYLDTFGSGRMLYVDFSSVIEGEASDMPPSDFYEFYIEVKANGLSTFTAGENRPGTVSLEIYSPSDDRYYKLYSGYLDDSITAEDTNANGVIDTFYFEVTEPLRVDRLVGKHLWAEANLGSISAPYAAVISDAELK